MHIIMHTHTRRHWCACMQTLVCMHVHMCPCACTHADTCPCACHTCTHTHTRIHTHTHAYTLTHTKVKQGLWLTFTWSHLPSQAGMPVYQAGTPGSVQVKSSGNGIGVSQEGCGCIKYDGVGTRGPT